MNKFKTYFYPVIETLVVILVMGVLTYWETCSWLDVFTIVLIGYGISISSNIDYGAFSKIHHKQMKTLANFNQLDEDICQLDIIIGNIFYKSKMLERNIKQIYKLPDIDFRKYNYNTLLNATVNGIWSLRLDSYKIKSNLESRISDIELNLPKNTCGNNIKSSIESIRSHFNSVIDNKFSYLPTSGLLKDMILKHRDQFNANYKTIDDALNSIKCSTLGYIDQLRKMKTKLQEKL